MNSDLDAFETSMLSTFAAILAPIPSDVLLEMVSIMEDEMRASGMTAPRPAPRLRLVVDNTRGPHA